MLNKKGGIAAEEMVGAITFILGVAIVLIIFSGCDANAESNKREKVESARYELDAMEDLNSFLESKYQTENVLEIIKVFYSNNKRDSYEKLCNADYKYFSEIYDNWRIVIYDQDTQIFYDSWDCFTDVYDDTRPFIPIEKILASTLTSPPVLNQNSGEYESIIIELQIKEKEE